MAATPVEVPVGITGLTGCKLTLYARGSDTLANPTGGGDALTAQSNRTWVYRATVDEALVGLYEAYVVDGSGVVLYTGAVDLLDTTDVHTVGELGDVAVSTRASATSVSAIATILSGITSLAHWLRTLARSSTANATALAEINTSGGTFDESTDSLQGIKDAGTTIIGYTITISDDDITPPAAAGLTTGYVLCLGTDGQPEQGVIITAQMVDGPGTAGYALDRGNITMTSAANGIAQHTGFVRGATYKFMRGTDDWWGDPRVAPDTATWSLAEILGAP